MCITLSALSARLADNLPRNEMSLRAPIRAFRGVGKLFTSVFQRNAKSRSAHLALCEALRAAAAERSRRTDNRNKETIDVESAVVHK